MMEGQSIVSESPKSDVVEERFRVDRRKLEDMIQDGEEVENSAAGKFFRMVAEETGVEIYWPTRLKIGAKSKKDPNIKVCGKPESILLAKQKVLEVLDTKHNKVTLKMDIPYTDHSHIIGKGGTTIQSIMEETECHIHFPDSNRTSAVEKSNQVSVTGQTAGVEKARCKLRSLLPIVVTFELPVISYNSPLPDPSSPQIQIILQTYAFTANFYQQNKRIFVTVRGPQKQFSRFRQGVHVLMEYLTGNDDFKLPVTMKTDIAVQNHQLVMGPASINIQHMKHACNVNIIFQSTVTPITDITASNRSAVFITGSFDNVNRAWKQLMNYLPLSLSFNLKEGQDVVSEYITNMMADYKVNIMMRLKKKENVKTITVQGPEKDSRILFEVRRQILDLDKSEIPICCDRHSAALASALFLATLSLTDTNDDIYKKALKQDERLKFLKDVHSAMANFDKNLFPVQLTTNPKVASIINNMMEQLNKSNSPDRFNNCNPTYSAVNTPCAEFCIPQTTYRPIPRMRKPENEDIHPSYAKQFINYTKPVGNNPFPFIQSNPIQNQSTNACNPFFTSDIWSPQLDSMPSWPGTQHSKFLRSSTQSSFNNWSIPQIPVETCSSSSQLNGTSWINNCVWSQSSEKSSSFKSSEPSKDSSHRKQYSWEKDGNKMSTTLPTFPINVSDATKSNSAENKSMPEIKDDIVKGNSVKDAKSVLNTDTSEATSSRNESTSYKSETDLNYLDSSYFKTTNYDEKWFLASKAFEQSVSDSIRTPTDVWSGYGFSKSMPDSIFKKVKNSPKNENADKTTEVHNFSASVKPVTLGLKSEDRVFSCSDYYSNIPSQLNLSLDECNHLPQLLGKLYLEKYIDVFLENEIDLSTFLTLNDADLQELGVTYVARKKMLAAISELSSHTIKKGEGKFSAAPGSERKVLMSKLSIQYNTG